MKKWLAVMLATVVATLIWTSGALAQEEMFITKGKNSFGFQGMLSITPAQDSGGSSQWTFFAYPNLARFLTPHLYVGIGGNIMLTGGGGMSNKMISPLGTVGLKLYSPTLPRLLFGVEYQGGFSIMSTSMTWYNFDPIRMVTDTVDTTMTSAGLSMGGFVGPEFVLKPGMTLKVGYQPLLSFFEGGASWQPHIQP